MENLNINNIQKQENDSVLTMEYVLRSQENDSVLTMEYVLRSIDKIIDDTAYINGSINALKNMEVSLADTSRGQAITAIVECRETTNQQTLRLLEKMYNNLKPIRISEEILRFQQFTEAVSRYPAEVASDLMKEAIRTLFVKPETAIAVEEN